MIQTLQYVYITFDTLYSTSRYISHFIYFFQVHFTLYITLPCICDTILYYIIPRIFNILCYATTYMPLHIILQRTFDTLRCTTTYI